MVQVTKFIWMDGKFVKWKDAKIHIMTHALHYGSAVFEGIRAYKSGNKISIFRLNDHINRLFFSAKSIGLKMRFSRYEITIAIKKIIKINNLNNAYIRPMIYYGYSNIGVFPQNASANFAIVALKDYKHVSNGLRVMTSKFIRYPERSIIFGSKVAGNYTNSILAMLDARKKGFDEALMIDINGFVSEGPAENIFLVKNGKVITPSSRSALHGVTRDTMLKLSIDLGLKAFAKKVALREARNADELFFCGTGKEISPIISLDGKKIGRGKIGPITTKIKNKFFGVVRGKEKKYYKWLTFVD